MTSTGLIFSESTSRLDLIRTAVEATGLFASIRCSDALESALLQIRQDDLDIIFYDAAVLCERHTEQLSRLVSFAALRDIPVLLFTEADDEKDRFRGFECGACDILSYAASPLEIVARLRRSIVHKRRLEDLRRTNDELARQTVTDSLSGLGNRRFFDMALDKESARTSRNGDSFALILLDLDHFKKINDTHGHQAGDAVIRALGGLLKESLRATDTVCRYGGEEFGLIMPATTMTAAAKVAERLRHEIASLAIPEIAQGHPITVSIGLSSASGPGRIDPAHIFQRADKALYAAKNSGRNRVVALSGARNLNVPRRSLPSLSRSDSKQERNLDLVRQ